MKPGRLVAHDDAGDVGVAVKLDHGALASILQRLAFRQIGEQDRCCVTTRGRQRKEALMRRGPVLRQTFGMLACDEGQQGGDGVFSSAEHRLEFLFRGHDQIPE